MPIRLTATPGYRFHIPALPRLGDYYLQNIRLMSGSDVLQPPRRRSPKSLSPICSRRRCPSNN